MPTGVLAVAVLRLEGVPAVAAGVGWPGRRWLGLLLLLLLLLAVLVVLAVGLRLGLGVGLAVGRRTAVAVRGRASVGLLLLDRRCLGKTLILFF